MKINTRHIVKMRNSLTHPSRPDGLIADVLVEDEDERRKRSTRASHAGDKHQVESEEIIDH